MKTKDTLPAELAAAHGSAYFLCWTNNCRGQSERGLYIMHATMEGIGNRTLCGHRIQEFGYPVGPDAQPSCKRCIVILRNLQALQTSLRHALSNCRTTNGIPTVIS